MSSVTYPLKNVRLQQLYDAGFNIADFVCWPPGRLDLTELKTFFEKHNGRISLRHFPADEFMKHATPFFPDQTDWDTIQKIAVEHNKDLYCLYNEVIAPSDAIFTANIILLDERNYKIEYFEGPGTPKDIERGTVKNLKIFERQIGVPMDPNVPEELKRAASYFKSFESTFRPVIIEYQIYPYAMGKRQSRDIAWEWRRWI